ncbi:hypothetical protein ETAA8_03050 [Anatilimnocola aggregata]|uniref:Uncharacterized protein n=1 Tax=Anatilimnocola aggregata TaxID=2528021 RepID=A0A517Y541_9BACT|nr:hypothetical protein ETAA8_03050 [Anatilimnocola aggregata]
MTFGRDLERIGKRIIAGRFGRSWRSCLNRSRSKRIISRWGGSRRGRSCGGKRICRSWSGRCRRSKRIISGWCRSGCSRRWCSRFGSEQIIDWISLNRFGCGRRWCWSGNCRGKRIVRCRSSWLGHWSGRRSRSEWVIRCWVGWFWHGCRNSWGERIVSSWNSGLRHRGWHRSWIGRFRRWSKGVVLGRNNRLRRRHRSRVSWLGRWSKGVFLGRNHWLRRGHWCRVSWFRIYRLRRRSKGIFFSWDYRLWHWRRHRSRISWLRWRGINRFGFSGSWFNGLRFRWCWFDRFWRCWFHRLRSWFNRLGRWFNGLRFRWRWFDRFWRCWFHRLGLSRNRFSGNWLHRLGRNNWFRLCRLWLRRHGWRWHRWWFHGCHHWRQRRLLIGWSFQFWALHGRARRHAVRRTCTHRSTVNWSTARGWRAARLATAARPAASERCVETHRQNHYPNQHWFDQFAKQLSHGNSLQKRVKNGVFRQEIGQQSLRVSRLSWAGIQRRSKHRRADPIS